MSNLTESTIQNAAIEWLQELGYQHQAGKTLTRDLKKVVLEDDLRTFLQTNYPDLPASAIEEAIAIFTQQAGMDVHYRNHDFHKKMSNGIDISWKDAQGKEYAQHIYPINYQDIEKNKFLCVDEMPIKGRNDRRTDLLIFINGLPYLPVSVAIASQSTSFADVYGAGPYVVSQSVGFSECPNISHGLTCGASVS